jgi:hypothetical protein
VIKESSAVNNAKAAGVEERFLENMAEFQV